jgi:IS5 family transposase
MMTGFERYTKKTRRAMFLEEMEQVVPWEKLRALIEPHYPTPGNGRRSKELEQMLRIYFLQQWFNLSDPGAEEALYDSAVLRHFAGIDLGSEPVPDETTICKFRHLLEEQNLGEQILGTVNLHLQVKGVRITTGTIVDATIIHAPCSTKNRDQSRDPEMHQAKKGKNWYFGMKAQCGCGQQDEDHSHGGSDSGQRFRCGCVARLVAWGRNASLGRWRLSRTDRGDPRMRSASAGFHPAAVPLQD